MSDAQLSDERSSRSLIGVRTARDARIVLVESADHRPERGEPVVVELAGQPTLAFVEIPASLILNAPSDAGQGEVIAHGASDPRVCEMLARVDAETATTAQAVLGDSWQVKSARRSLDRAWATIHLVAGPTCLPNDLIDRLAAALQAAIRLEFSETDDAPLPGEVTDVPDSLEGGDMGQKRQYDEYGKLEPDD